MVLSNPAMLPPGFRFHPTDEELIVHYLRNRAASSPSPVSIIADVDIYKFDPWDLPSKAAYGDREWYFFSPRDRKYPNGIRPNRAAGCGYWKATGTDKPIHGGGGGGRSESVGVKKALVFYKGRPPKGTKTNWIMHEYRLAAADAHAANTYRPMKFRNASMRLDDWVLCRIYKKNSHASPMAVPPLSDHEQDEPCALEENTPLYAMSSAAAMILQGAGAGGAFPPLHAAGAAMQRMQKIPSISDLLNEYSLSQLFDDGGSGAALDMAPRPQPDHHHHHAALVGHPVVTNHFLMNNSMAQLAQMDSSSAAAAAAASTSAAAAGATVEAATWKRKRSDAELTSQPAAAAKKPNGSCVGATFQIGSGLQGSSLGLGHQMLLHSNMGMN